MNSKSPIFFPNSLILCCRARKLFFPPEASDLQQLLTLGQQFAQINFEANPATQAAFQSQLATWFGSKIGHGTALLGIPKTFIGLSVVAITVGTGLALALVAASFLGIIDFDSNSLLIPDTAEPPASAPLEAPESAPASTAENVKPSDLETPQATGPPPSATPVNTRSAPPSSLGDTLPGAPSSLGDTIPSTSPSPQDPIPLATSVPITTSNGSIVDNGDGGNTDSSDTGGDTTKTNPDDKGHGNEPDGYDPDNPGQSSGVPDKTGDDGGSNLGRGGGGGSSGGGSSGGGSGGSSDKGGKGDDKGGGKGGGKNK